MLQFYSCCYSTIAMAQAADSRKRNNSTHLQRFNESNFKRILVQRAVSSKSMVIIDVLAKDSAQMSLVKDDFSDPDSLGGWIR